MWLPFLRPSVWDGAVGRGGGGQGDMFIRRYAARPFERWISGFDGGGLWFFDPRRKALWRGRLEGHRMWAEEARWYAEDGEEIRTGGSYRWSRRWRELTLWGPCGVDQVRISIGRRRQWRAGPYNWPAGRIARFVLEEGQ